MRGLPRYLTLPGRGMLPFYIPWELHPQWVEYPTPDMARDRAQYSNLLRNRKVLVSTRASKHGNAWRVRAAVDTDGLSRAMNLRL